MDYRNNERHFLRRFFRSFKYAWSGVVHIVRYEQNMKIHLCIAIAVITLSFLLDVSTFEKMILILVIAIVISLEAVNTAIERVVDLVTAEKHPLAKVAKDAAAAAVLLFSLFAVVIGFLIFLNPILQLLYN